MSDMEFLKSISDTEIKEARAQVLALRKDFNLLGLNLMHMTGKIERTVEGIAGTIEVEGEKTHYRFHSIGKGQCIIESYYDAPISIADNGFGLEYAIGLLRTEVSAQKRKRKNK